MLARGGVLSWSGFSPLSAAASQSIVLAPGEPRLQWRSIRTWNWHTDLRFFEERPASVLTSDSAATCCVSRHRLMLRARRRGPCAELSGASEASEGGNLIRFLDYGPSFPTASRTSSSSIRPTSRSLSATFRTEDSSESNKATDAATAS